MLILKYKVKNKAHLEILITLIIAFKQFVTSNCLSEKKNTIFVVFCFNLFIIYLLKIAGT